MDEGEEAREKFVPSKWTRGPKWLWPSVMVSVSRLILAVVVALGLLDPMPKRAILKADEIGGSTGTDGIREQIDLHCFEGETSRPHGSRHSAYSIVHFSNDTAHLSVIITVSEMNDTDEATRIFEDIVASRSTNGLNRTLVEVGDGGLLEGYFVPEDGQDTGALSTSTMKLTSWRCTSWGA